ncbi:SRPBCC family protein, partial [Streptomyces collinus]|uniref:SRPBCC family protein n=1 Tax=Streptomyces collinus TaxID=42684 RepID=UPI0036B0ED01
MTRMTLSAKGTASPDTVWQRYAGVDQWASWSPQIKAVHSVGHRLSPGLSGTVESAAGIRAAFVVEAIDHHRRTWTWRVRLGRLQIRLHHEVRPRGRGSATSLTMHGPRLVLLAYAPLARLASCSLPRCRLLSPVQPVRRGEEPCAAAPQTGGRVPLLGLRGRCVTHVPRDAPDTPDPSQPGAQKGFLREWGGGAGLPRPPTKTARGRAEEGGANREETQHRNEEAP